MYPSGKRQGKCPAKTLEEAIERLIPRHLQWQYRKSIATYLWQRYIFSCFYCIRNAKKYYSIQEISPCKQHNKRIIYIFDIQRHKPTINLTYHLNFMTWIGKSPFRNRKIPLERYNKKLYLCKQKKGESYSISQ